MTDALLTDTDQRILQWQREGRPDAEIAVRLGMTVGETKDRIRKLKARMEVADEDVARWRRPQPGVEPVIGEDPAPLADEPAQPSLPGEKTYSRRAVVAAGLAGLGASAAAAAGGFALFGRGDDEAPAAGVDGTPTSRPGSTPTPGAQPTAHPGLGAITRDDRAWDRARLPNGGAIPYTSGVGFISTANGDIDVMRLAGVPDDWSWGYGYRASRSGRFVSGEEAHAPGGVTRAGLLDREAGTAWSWDPTVLKLIALGDSAFAFADVRRDSSYSGNVYLAGPVHVTDAGLRPLATVDLGVSISNDVLLAGKGAESDLFAVLPHQGQPHIIDLAAGTAVRGELAPADHHPYAIAPQSPPGVVAILAWRTDGETGYPVRLDYDATGTIVRQAGLNEATVETQRFSPYSPDGRWIVEQDSLRDTSHSLGDQENWIYTELRDRGTGRAQFRVLSGQLRYGISTHRRWLADSSAFIVEAGRHAVEFEAYNEFRSGRAFYFVDPVTHEMELLDQPPETVRGDESDPNSGYWYHGYFGGPEPAPDDPDLFAFGGLAVYNRRTGQWFAPGNFVQPLGGDPWDGNQSGELRFTFPPGGKDWASSGTILPPYVEEGPVFRKEVELRIARAGTCVNLRSAPTSNAEVLECLADDVRFTVIAPPDPLPRESDYGGFEPGRRPAFWNADLYESDADYETAQMYVHGRIESGATGWVAIQYLDWAV